MKFVLGENDLAVLEPEKVKKGEEVFVGNSKKENASGKNKLSLKLYTSLGNFDVPEEIKIDSLKSIFAGLETNYSGSGYQLADTLAEYNGKIQISNTTLKRDKIILMYQYLENNKSVYSTHEFDDLLDFINKAHVKSV